MSLFNKTFSDYKRNWSNAGSEKIFNERRYRENPKTVQASSGITGKISTLFHSNDYNSLKEFNRLLEAGIKPMEAYKNTMTKCSETAKKNAVSIAKGSMSFKEATRRLKEMSVGAKAASIGLKALSVVGNMLLSMGIAWAVGKLFEGIDYLVHKTERLTENLEESVSAFDDSTQKIKEYNDELQTTNERIAELQKLDAYGEISLVEKEELERLKDTNKELERKIALEKAELIQKQKKVLRDNEKLFNDKVISDYTGAKVNTTTELGYIFKDIDDLSEKLKNGDISADEYSSELKYLEDFIGKNMPTVNTMLGAYEDIIKAGGELEGQDKARYEQLKKVQDSYLMYTYRINGSVDAYKALSKEQQKSLILEDLMDRKKSKKEAKAILKAMSDEDIENFAEIPFDFKEPDSKDFKNVEEYGKKYAEAMVEAMKKKVEESAPKVSDSFIASLSRFEKLSKGLDQLDKIYADVYDKEDFDWSSILNNKDFTEAFSNLGDDYQNFVKTIASNPSNIKACQSAFNDLTTAYILNSDALQNVTDETKASAIAFLEEKGIKNAEAIVTEQLSAKERALALQKEFLKKYGYEVADASYAEVSAFLASAEASDVAKSSVAQLALEKLSLNQTKINTASDIEQVIALANAARASASSIAALQNAKAILNGEGSYASMYTTDSKGNKVLSGSMGALRMYESAQSTIDAINKGTFDYGYTKVKASDFITPISADYGGGSSTNKAKDSASKSAEDAAKEALKAITGYFDWVKVRFDRLARNTKLSEDAIKRAVGLSAKQLTTNTAISSVRAEIDAYRAGADRYLAQANWFAGQAGLSGDIVDKIQNGSIDLTKYDDITKEKIQEYQSHFENYLNATDKILELTDKEKELAQSRLSNISDFYDLAIAIHDSLQDVNESFLKFQETQGFSAVSDSVRKVYESSVVEAQKVYDNSLQKLNNYRSEFNSLVSQGYLKEGSDEWSKAKKEMNGFEKAVYDAGISLQELNDKITEISYQKIQNVIDGLERSVSKLDAWTSLLEARDEKVPESVYQEKMDANNASILKNKELRDAKLAEQALYDVNSTRYQELAEDINKIDEAIINALESNESLKDSIFELRFKPLDEAIEKYDKLSDEIDSFLGLLDEDAYFDKQGRATSELTSALALMSQQLSIGKQKILDMRVGLDKLQEAFDNGLISETEFNEKSEEYRGIIQDSAKANYDLSKSITDLYLNQMSKESEYLQDIIDKRKEALQAKEDYYNYDKNLRDKRKSVAELESQIAALEGTTNKSALSELKRLKQQRDEAQEELDETKRSHSIEMQEKGYDSLSDKISDVMESVEYELTHSAEKQESVLTSMLDSVVDKYADAFGKINSIIRNTGWVGSSAFNDNQQQIGTPKGNVSASDTATSINSSNVNDNASTNSRIESEIMQKEDTTNRKVAELKVSPTSVTLEEGKSASVNATVRPNDAKNKTLAWKSSNAGVATISNGTIHAVSPGSCTITVSTTDGSNISQNIGVSVTKKPDPPKPAPAPAPTPAPAQPQSNPDGGDGIPNIGDYVTFANGRYYYSPGGASPTGNKNLGKKVYITNINKGKAKPYHISTGNKLGRGDLGWLKLDQLRGYRKGKTWFKKDETAFTHKNEVIVSKDGGILRQLQQGDSVFNERKSNNLAEWAKLNPLTMFGGNYAKMSTPNVGNITNKIQPIHNEIHYDSLLTVNGNIDKDTFPGVKEMCEKACKYTTNYLYREGRKKGW